MSEVWDWLTGHGRAGTLALKFARAFNDWELDMVVNLLNAL